MFKSSKYDATSTSARIISFFLNSFKPNSTTYNNSVQTLFIAESFNVFSCVRVNVLQTLREFIIQSVDERHERPTNFNDLAPFRIRWRIIERDIFRVLYDNP